VDYLYEQLGPERFQALCQALLVAETRGMQCFPIAQPDGGRDGVGYTFPRSGRDFVVYQVKFVRNPQAQTDPHKWLTGIIEDEAPKIRELLPKGAVQFHLITNVAGTAHLDAGSIDKVNAILAREIPIPSAVWWRDDLNRHVDVEAGVKWSYPEILRGSDVLGALLASDLGETRARRANAIRTFMSEQCKEDEEVKFKQVELQSNLMDLFIDVPAKVTKGPRIEDSYAYSYAHYLFQRVAEIVATEHRDENSRESSARPTYDEDPAAPAGALLLSGPIQRNFPFVVVEGAPGQGKSTLAQFICQVHRLRLLGRDRSFLRRYHCPPFAHLPIKVDLTEYAAWIGGSNPFDLDGAPGGSRSGSNRHLESFIAAMIADKSGGASFSVDDLFRVAEHSSLLLALDGLDEIADLKRRNAVIGEITAAVNRLDEIAAGLQVVVTTRPSAFAGVSEFPAKTFHYFQLVSLSRELIFDYTARWARVRRIGERDASAIRRNLRIRLGQAHLRDLARNPMQLAILLSVLHSRGSSLPDKRTALYDIYVELFLAREAEKNEVVREYQELLIDVHRYLAWILQAEAEAGRELGRLEYGKLLEILRQYLEEEGHNPDLAQTLFEGTLRVVFLVPRVEGTFEFEVQPQREYFAGKYLYETSRYSPAGRERRGTMPDRFDALVRSPYWLNVTRFFAGCLSKGELPALVERLEALVDDPEYALISYPRLVGATLAGDWVFSQSQRSLRKVITLVLDGPGLSPLLSSGSTGRSTPITLPSGAGREELVEAAFQILDKVVHRPPQYFALTRLLNANSNRGELKDRWLARFQSAHDEDRIAWANIGHLLGLLGLCSPDELGLGKSEKDYMPRSLYCWWSSAQVRNLIRSDPGFLSGIMRSALASGDGIGLLRPETDPFSSLINCLSTHGYFGIFHQHGNGESLTASRIHGRSPTEKNQIDESTLPADILAVGRVAMDMSALPAEEWKESILPWATLVEAARSAWGDSWALYRLACLASVTVKDRFDGDLDLFDRSLDLCQRARYARLKAGNARWWKDTWALEPRDRDEELFRLTLFLYTAGVSAFQAVTGVVEKTVSSLSPAEFKLVADTLADIGDGVGPWDRRPPRRKLRIEQLPASSRVAALIGFSENVNTRWGIYDLFFREYHGSDPIVTRFCVEAVAHRIAANRDIQRDMWETLIRHLDRGYRGELPFLEDMFNYGRIPPLPHDLARQVLSSGESYPYGLVLSAERALEQVVFEKRAPLLRLAEEEEWFSDL
jgi:hypothetical protein